MTERSCPICQKRYRGASKGGEEPLNGMRYPSLRMDNTQDSAPIACQCLQCVDRQPPTPPTRNRGGTPPGGLLPGTPSFATGAARAAGGRRKGHLTFASPPLPTLLGRRSGGDCQCLLLRPRHHRGGATTVSRGSKRGPSLDRPRRKLPRNLQWMQGLLDKSIVRSRTHLGQGRAEQR